MDYDDDEDDEVYKGMYENGHWEWSDAKGALDFISDISTISEKETLHTVPIALGPIEFRDDLDVLEQLRYRKRFQRNLTTNDVVSLQDVKDFVLFTAPKNLLNASLVNILHLPVTERFLRALIVYCQYFLQISEEMDKRSLELQTKVHTKRSEEIESVFRDNLEELRLLLAKEYGCILTGAADFVKYHHMGPSKQSVSMTKREKILFESLLRISIQIVWLALGRKLFTQIETEVHRIFKTDIYNITLHKLTSSYRLELDEREKHVLYGHCLPQGTKITTCSPLISEIHCNKEVDYRLMGLGIVQYPNLSPRLRFFEHILIAPEQHLKSYNVSMGIIGLRRDRFDTTLKLIKQSCASSATNSTTGRRPSHSSAHKGFSRNSRGNAAKTASSSGKNMQVHVPLYCDIVIPDKEDLLDQLDVFADDELQRNYVSEIQRKKWLMYVSHNKRRKMKTKVSTP